VTLGVTAARAHLLTAGLIVAVPAAAAADMSQTRTGGGFVTKDELESRWRKLKARQHQQQQQ